MCLESKINFGREKREEPGIELSPFRRNHATGLRSVWIKVTQVTQVSEWLHVSPWRWHWSHIVSGQLTIAHCCGVYREPLHKSLRLYLRPDSFQILFRVYFYHDKQDDKKSFFLNFSISSVAIVCVTMLFMTKIEKFRKNDFLKN